MKIFLLRTLKRKATLLICLFLGLYHLSSAQQKLKGFQSVFNDYGTRRNDIYYTRSFFSSGNVFSTVYKVYNTSNKHIITITAEHYVSAKKVTVGYLLKPSRL